MDRFVSLVFVALCAILTPALAEPGDREIVKVNGTSIRQSEVFERLWQRHGNETVEEMIDELKGLLKHHPGRSPLEISVTRGSESVAELECGGEFAVEEGRQPFLVVRAVHGAPMTRLRG